MKVKYTILFNVIFITLGLPIGLQAQVVVSTITNYSHDLDASSLSTPDEAGTDLNPDIETATNFNLIDVRNMATAQQWKVAVSRQDINWPAAFTLYIKRNSSGTPCMSCSGVDISQSPSSYVTITPLETDFIYGSGEVTGMEIQFKVSGISLTVPAQSYSTEIMYTLYGD